MTTSWSPSSPFRRGPPQKTHEHFTDQKQETTNQKPSGLHRTVHPGALAAPWLLRRGKGELFDMRDAPHRQIAVAADSNDVEAIAARVQLQKTLDHLAAEAAKETLPLGKKKAKKKSS